MHSITETKGRVVIFWSSEKELYRNMASRGVTTEDGGSFMGKVWLTWGKREFAKVRQSKNVRFTVEILWLTENKTHFSDGVSLVLLHRA